ncbi:rRNA methyltransferase 3, mitochondrial-like isoform X2 [Gordionus sp. m RMFG-2023]|uniref:rRNA methyltransferase 3, mitochondrial-like isoform X2 n=1 Tax=Gordionus sp. m RMFG-2023 TaxID=3053472 RepID=UPI0031FCB048
MPKLIQKRGYDLYVKNFFKKMLDPSQFTNYIFVEGETLINDIIKIGFLPKFIFHTPLYDIKNILNNVESSNEIDCFEIKSITMKKLTQVLTPPGIGIFYKPEYDKIIGKYTNSFPINIICNNVRDPGNMGTLIRTMAAIGAKQMIIISGCVNPWSPKVIRSAAGGHFRIPVLEINSLNACIGKNYINPQTTTLIIAQNIDPNSKIANNLKIITPNIDYNKLNKNHIHPSTEIALLLGNESWGFEYINTSSIFFKSPWAKIISTYIPMERETDSLNVTIAASILASFIKRFYYI